MTELARVHPAGFFAGSTGRAQRFAYRLRREDGGGITEIDDPYRFPSLLGELDLHLLGEGKDLRIYDHLGAHPREIEGVAGVAFAVWAPNARRVSVVGSFNNWDGRCHPMRLRPEDGIWEIFIPGVAVGAIYKYEIKAATGELLPLKADPLARQTERPPRTGSIVAAAERYEWSDKAWIDARAKANSRGRAHLDLRMPSGILGAGAGGRQSQPRLSRACRTPRPLCEGYGLHPCRADADHGVSLRGLLGLSADGAVCAYRALRHARTSFALWWSASMPPASGSSPIGCRVIFPAMPMALPASTGRISTSMPIRARACTATGIP